MCDIPRAVVSILGLGTDKVVGTSLDTIGGHDDHGDLEGERRGTGAYADVNGLHQYYETHEQLGDDPRELPPPDR